MANLYVTRRMVCELSIATVSFCQVLRRGAFLLALVVATFPAIACSTSKAPNSNSTANSNLKLNSNAGSSAEQRSSQPITLDIKEPERYSAAMTISIQGTLDVPASMATQQFGFSKLGADRRWAFTLPAPLGRVVYLEKSGLKYLVLFDRKQYVELAGDSLGFQMSRDLTTAGIADRLKARARFEQLGSEPVNGRTARKYRVTSAQNDSSAAVSGVIFIDEETGLPLDCELSTTGQGGEKSRVIVEARELALNPDRSEFDVPAGMKKISPQEAKQQIDGFASAIGYFAETLQPKQSTMKPPAIANADRAAAIETSRRRKR
jgi:hypothetical protein